MICSMRFSFIGSSGQDRIIALCWASKPSLNSGWVMMNRSLFRMPRTTRSPVSMGSIHKVGSLGRCCLRGGGAETGGSVPEVGRAVLSSRCAKVGRCRSRDKHRDPYVLVLELTCESFHHTRYGELCRGIGNGDTRSGDAVGG